MKKRRSEKIIGIIVPIIPIICIIVIWEAMALAANDVYVLPTFAQTVSRFFELFTYGAFYSALFSTLLRSLIAFAISFVIASILSFLASEYKNAKRAITPIIAFMRALPTIAVVLLLVVWTNSQVAPVIVTMLVVLPTVYANMTDAFSVVDKDVVQALKLYGVPKKQILKKVIVPQMTPAILHSVGAGLSLNLKLMVAAEVLSQTPVSMGYLLNFSKTYYEISTMLSLVIVSVVIGILIELVFGILSKKAGKWQ